MKNIIISIILVLILGFFYINSNETKETGGETIKIGVIASLTGKGAARGESTLQGLELAMHTIEEENILKGRKIEFIIQDVPLEKPKDALSAFNQLTETEGVVAIIGPMGSSVVMSVAPVVDQKGIPIIVHAASVRKATEGNEYLFRLWPTADQYAKAILAEINHRDYKQIAFLSATHANTEDLSTLLKEKLLEKVIIEEEVSVETTDFRTQLSKIKAAEPDVIFLNLFAGQIGIGAKQAKELGIQTDLFTNSVMSATEVELGGDALEGIWSPRFSGYTVEGKNKFVEFFGEEPVIPDNASSGHDALIILAKAIAKKGANPEKIKDFLYRNEFDGVIGHFSFSDDGNAELPISLLVVKDGELIELE